MPFFNIMKIHIEKDNKVIEKQIDKKIKVIDLLKELNISPEAVIVTRGDEVITEDEYLSNDDEIKLLSVISGG